MADIVRVGEIGYKRRNPWGVFGLALITFGIYTLVWYYKINNELRNSGVDNEPAVAVLAVTLGGFVIVPPFVSYYRTADRILRGQEQAEARERITPVLALVLIVFLGPFGMPYYQTQLNKVWDALLERGGEVMRA